METKLKKLLRKRNISQKTLYDKISKIYETPIGQYALSQIVNGKKLNYHIITLVKICNVLKVKPQSIVESDVLDSQLLKSEYIKSRIAAKEASSIVYEEIAGVPVMGIKTSIKDDSEEESEGEYLQKEE